MIELFHDYTSPASAVAVLRAQRLADEGLPVVFEGVESVGVDAVLPVTLDVLSEMESLREAAAQLGLTLRRPNGLPPTALAHALGHWAEQSGLGASWRQTCYRAFWEQGADIAVPAVLRALALRAGLDGMEAEDVLGDRDRIRRVRLRTAAL
ncbi:MAG TPA: DsbA family protein, partial [Egibacteraceae bacterium]|nr:DsbA family protein [Egibacteraceae bacterium]